MKSKIILLSAAVAGVMFLFACNNNNGPVGSITGNNNNGNNNQPTTFSFNVGNRFIYLEYSIDSTGAKTFLDTVHETFVQSGLTIGGKSGVYLALDSTIVTGGLLSPAVDSMYVYTNGTEVMEYGLVANYVKNAFGAFGAAAGVGGNLSVTPKWDMIVDAGNAYGWLIDTTTMSLALSGISPTGALTIPINVTVNGTDIGDTTMLVNGVSLKADHTHGSGGLSFNFNAIIFSVSGSAPLEAHYYMSFSPTCLVRSLALPTTFSLTEAGTTTPYPFSGTERDLVSWQAK